MTVGRGSREKALGPRIMIIHLVGHAWYYCCTLCMFHLYYYTRHSRADRKVITLCADEHLSAPLLFIAKMKSSCLSRSLLCTSSLIVPSQLLNFACERFKWRDGGVLIKAESSSLLREMSLYYSLFKDFFKISYRPYKNIKGILCGFDGFGRLRPH